MMVHPNIHPFPCMGAKEGTVQPLSWNDVHSAMTRLMKDVVAAKNIVRKSFRVKPQMDQSFNAY